MGWAVFLGVLAVLAFLPLGVSLRYDEDGPLVRLLAGPVRLTLFPRPRKKPVEPQKEPKQEEKPAAAPEKPLPKPPQPPKTEPQPKPGQGGSVTDFLPLLKLALDFLKELPIRLRVKLLRLHLVLAGGDPADLAANYGRACAAVAGLMPQLERMLRIKKKDVRVCFDYASDQTRVAAGLDITITLGRLLALGVYYGLRAIKIYLTILKKRKGGAAT